MTGVLHTARINAIEVIMSSDKLIEMVKNKLVTHHMTLIPISRCLYW